MQVEPEPPPRLGAVARGVAREIDPGRDRGDARAIEMVVADKLLAQRLASGNDIACGALVKPACRRAVVDRCRDMARAHDRRRRAQRGAGERREPGIGRAVGIQHVDVRVRLEPVAQRRETPPVLARDRQHFDRHAEPDRMRVHRRLGGTEQQHAVAALQHAGGLGERAQLLPTPAAGGFGMNNRELPGHLLVPFSNRRVCFQTASTGIRSIGVSVVHSRSDAGCSMMARCSCPSGASCAPRWRQW